MSLPTYAMDAARRIAARRGVAVDAVLSAYRAAAKGKAVNAASLFLGDGVITPNERGTSAAPKAETKISRARRTRDSKRNRKAVAV